MVIHSYFGTAKNYLTTWLTSPNNKKVPLPSMGAGLFLNIIQKTMETIITIPQEELTMKQKLQDILMMVSWREIARNYFGKSSSWLYHKLDGIDGNGGKGQFSETEKEQMRGALCDLADRLRRAADNI